MIDRLQRECNSFVCVLNIDQKLELARLCFEKEISQELFITLRALDKKHEFQFHIQNEYVLDVVTAKNFDATVSQTEIPYYDSCIM